MANTKIFVNLPVRDLNKSKQFFEELGYTFNKQFTDNNAACLVVSDDIYAMLLTEDFFKRFTKKKVADARMSTEAMIALSAESKEKIDELVDRAVELGGKEGHKEEQEGMYGRAFEDPDGHIWEYVWMDQSKIQPTN